MAASASDKFRKSYSFTTKSLASNVDASTTTFPLNNTTNVPTDTGVDFIVDRVDSNGTSTSSKRELCRGIVSGSNITNVVRGLHGTTAQTHDAGATVEFVASGAAWNDLVDGILTSFDQDGTLKAGAVDSAAVLANDVVTTVKILDSNVTSAKLAPGVPVQLVGSTFSAVATGTTVVPEDDTKPQITEGTEFMTLAITPKSATNRLYIRVNAFLSQSAATNDIIGALFQDASADALAAKDLYAAAAGAPVNMIIEHDMVAGTTSSTTFRFRAGPVNAATVTFNGFAGARKFGGITLSSISITEYKA